MSSFKRKTTSKQPPLSPGTRLSPASATTVITSTGIPSFDDILGGGLPLSCSLLVLAPDVHSAYGELVQKYFIAQGIASGHKLCVVDNHTDDLLAGCMWMPGNAAPSTTFHMAEEEDEEETGEHDAKIKIAWRYEQMKQFQTTVSTANQSAEDYCRVFDLTCRIPDSTIQQSLSSGRVVPISVNQPADELTSVSSVLNRIEAVLSDAAESNSGPVRVCIPSLGSSQWGDVSPQNICFFLVRLRDMLHRYPQTCAAISFPPHICTETWGGPGWIAKLGWLCDASITLAAFTANPALTALFTSHHGLVHIHSLPAPGTLMPPSDRFSTLRGLSSSGENNLAFKCMRKRLIFETLHLDLEGGVGERRTMPSANAFPLEKSVPPTHKHGPEVASAVKGGAAAVKVELEQTEGASPVSTSTGSINEEKKVKKAKAKKRVAFTSDRPDLYDF